MILSVLLLEVRDTPSPTGICHLESRSALERCTPLPPALLSRLTLSQDCSGESSTLRSAARPWQRTRVLLGRLTDQVIKGRGSVCYRRMGFRLRASPDRILAFDAARPGGPARVPSGPITWPTTWRMPRYGTSLGCAMRRTRQPPGSGLPLRRGISLCLAAAPTGAVTSLPTRRLSLDELRELLRPAACPADHGAGSRAGLPRQGTRGGPQAPSGSRGRALESRGARPARTLSSEQQPVPAEGRRQVRRRRGDQRDSPGRRGVWCSSKLPP